jgi:hypothetical protein
MVLVKFLRTGEHRLPVRLDARRVWGSRHLADIRSIRRHADAVAAAPSVALDGVVRVGSAEPVDGVHL